MQSRPTGEERSDLVVISLPGVQRWIAQARSTADLAAASEISATLASAAAQVCAGHGQLVIPTAVEPDGVPNRVVALVPDGQGTTVAGHAADAVRKTWDELVRTTFPDSQPATPGMPTVNWVCVPPGDGGYAAQWARAQRALAARRRVRDFDGTDTAWTGRSICSLSPRWPAEDRSPPGGRSHERATLSAACWVKRRWASTSGFPSTPSFASAPFRRKVLAITADGAVRAAVTELRDAVRELRVPGENPIPGLTATTDPWRWFAGSAGPWVYPERWQAEPLARDLGREATEISDTVERGRRAAVALRRLAEDTHGFKAPHNHLAIVVQDLDGMGLFLSGRGRDGSGHRCSVDPDAHRDVSGRLATLAKDQRDALATHELMGMPVYAGGDDLLALVPATTALAAAHRCHELVPQELPTASTAVLFFHRQSGLQSTVAAAHELLVEAKASVRGKHALAVGYLRRSGVREQSIQPWTVDGMSAAGCFDVFAREAAHPLSPRLLADLQRDEAELATLFTRSPLHYRAELTRLVKRHLPQAPTYADAQDVATQLERLAHAAPGASLLAPARVGVFLRQEAT